MSSRAVFIKPPEGVPLQVPVVEAARFALWDADRCGVAVASDELHRICYYAQGQFYALWGEPLFIEPVFAHEAGPRFPALDEAFADCQGPLPVPSSSADLPLMRQTDELRTSWRRVFGVCRGEQYSFDHLSDPYRVWLAAGRRAGEIPPELIRDFVQRLFPDHLLAESRWNQPNWARALDRLRVPEVTTAVREAAEEVQAGGMRRL